MCLVIKSTTRTFFNTSTPNKINGDSDRTFVDKECVMLKYVKLSSLLACLVLTANVYAADPDIPTLNPDEGRIGEIRRVVDESEFKVCADPDNMPFSNSKQEGFEDKIHKYWPTT